jgi:WD40 repeat protein
VVSAGDDGAVVAFDPLAKEPPKAIGLHDGPVRALALISLQGRLLAASGSDDGSIVLWDPNGSGAVTRIELGLDVRALTAIGERLLVGTDEGHLVVEVEPG